MTLYDVVIRSHTDIAARLGSRHLPTEAIMSQPGNPHTPWRARMRARLQALATYDVFPDFSARARRALYNPLGVLLLAALAAILCGLFLHPQGLVLGGGALAVIVLGIAWPWVSLRGL